MSRYERGADTQAVFVYKTVKMRIPSPTKIQLSQHGESAMELDFMHISEIIDTMILLNTSILCSEV